MYKMCLCFKETVSKLKYSLFLVAVYLFFWYFIDFKGSESRANMGATHHVHCL